MALPRISNLLRFAALSLIATSAFAGGPWFRGGAAIHGGGFHGGGFHGGGYRGGAGFRVYGSVGVLPRGYATYRWGGNPYYYNGGLWYRPWRGAYIGCYPPVGLWLDVLPFGFATVYYGGMPYYTYQDVYYTDSPSGGYMVADPPDQPEARRPAPAPSVAPEHDALLISPKEGQGADKMKADRADAQRYARKVSGYDPAFSDPGDPGTPRARRAYHKALRSYLEERGYTVD
jgi:hypothetical protein